MDKQRNKPIVVKINGQERSLHEDVKEEGKKTADQRKKAEPEQAPSLGDKQEKEAASETAAASEEQFTWVLPESKGDHYFHSTKKKTSRPKKAFKKNVKASKYTSGRQPHQPDRKAILSTVLISLIAILVGTSFGLVMLNMVKSDQRAVTETVAPVHTMDDKEGAAGSQQAMTKSVYVIQTGVFTTKDAAENSIAALKAKGIPAAIIERDGSFFVFIGAADSIDGAKSLGAYLAKEEVDFYAKEINISINQTGELKKEETGFLQSVLSLYDVLVTLSAAGISSGNISADAEKAFTEQAAQWKKNKDANVEHGELKNIRKELDEAIHKISSYEGDGGERIFIAVQQHLLHVLASFQKI